MMRFPTVLPWLALVQCFAGSGFAQKIEAKVVDREVIQQRLAQISGKNPERKARLQQLFAEAKIPSLTVHSVTQDNLSILHGLKDRLKLVRADDYYDTYRLVAFYLAALDSLLPEKTRP